MSLLARVQAQEASQEGFAVRPDSWKRLHSQLKSQLIESLGLDTVAHILDTEAVDAARKELQVAMDEILHAPQFERLNRQEMAQLSQEVLDEIVGLGPLQPLLDDDQVTEVMVNGCKSLFYEKGGKLHSARRVFESPEQIMVVVDRILAPLGRRLDDTCPVVSARLANGDRVNAVINPIAIEGPVVTIRKFSNRITSLQQLVQLGSLPSWYAQLLSWAVKFRQDIAVVGGTGSGKTTLLNALSCEIDHEERIVTIEDSAELQFKTHPHVVPLETRDASIEGAGQVTVRDLVKNALRMRPDRIVVGEVRGSEAIDMLQAMNTGHDGSLTTLHAGSEREAILRLVLMARFGMDLPTDVIEGQIGTALDLIVMSARKASGKRYITSLSQVFLDDSGQVQLETCVTFDSASVTWTLVKVPDFISLALHEGVLTERQVQQWLQSCA